MDQCWYQAVCFHPLTYVHRTSTFNLPERTPYVSLSANRDALHPEGSPVMNSPKRQARTAGVLYLLVGLFGAFAQAFVYPKMYVPGDAAATAGNLVANAGLVRLGVVFDLVNETAFVFMALTLYSSVSYTHLRAHDTDSYLVCR